MRVQYQERHDQGWKVFLLVDQGFESLKNYFHFVFSGELKDHCA